MADREFKDRSMATRISLTQLGQLTWVDLDGDNKCAECAHCHDPIIKKGKRKGWCVCRLVKVHTKKDGVPFNPKTALACSQFEVKK